MLKNANPLFRTFILFVVGFVLIMGAEWLVSVVKGTEFVFNWLHFATGGALIAILDLIFPSEKRKENRDDLKKKFK